MLKKKKDVIVHLFLKKKLSAGVSWGQSTFLYPPLFFYKVPCIVSENFDMMEIYYNETR